MMYTAAPLLFVLLVALCQAVPDIDLTNYRCKEGWTLFGQKCWKYVHNQVNWSQAKLQCKELGATLAQPKLKAENDFLAQIRNKNGGAQIWIGLMHSRTGFRGQGGSRLFWVDGTWGNRAQLPPGSSNNEYIWNNNVQIHEGCFHMSASIYNSAWNDNQCDRKMDFVCEKRISPDNLCTCPQGWTFLGSKCYKFSGIKTWNQAKSTCTSLGSKIAMPKTPVENENLSFFRDLNGGNALWIGLRRDYESNSWINKWQDDTILELNRHFYPGGSNIRNNHANEHCYHLNPKQYGLAWNAMKCDTKWGFVCEKDYISAR